MLRTRSLPVTALIVTSALGIVACEPVKESERLEALDVDHTARAAIRDATRGGDPGFHWLPPIVAMGTTAGAFDGTQFPSIRVENFSTRVILDTIPSEEITILGDRYTWDWDTSQYTINLANTYRLSVIVRNRVIGYTDVRLYTAGSMISPIRNTVQIYDGTTLSVAFHLNQCAPVVCEALDDCHVKGVCQPDTGECTNPIGRNGRRCDDLNSCTTGDVCMAGECTGATTLEDGAECDDDNACTQTDTCQAGECVGDDEVECEARDQCHEPGECESTFGLCSEPAAPEGQGCDDGNACTIGDSCEHGSCVPTTLAICYAIDECHLAGSCNPITGCSTPLRPDSTPCNADNDRCTRDRCTAGVCTVGDPVICAAANDCQEAGVCNPTNGRCSSASRPDGTTCDDSNGCTLDDFCRNGVCRPGEELECTALDACHRPGQCDRFTGLCDNPFALDGTACSDEDACTLGDECSDGVCQSGVSLTCLASDDCHIAAACDPELGCVDDESPAEDGSECDDNNFCTTGESCVAGVCTGGNQVEGCVENEAECVANVAPEPLPPVLPADPVAAVPLCTTEPGGYIHVGPDEVAAYSNCRVQGVESKDSGGGVRVEFGGRLTLTDVLITGNTSYSSGGGIYNDGVITLIRVRVTGNTAFGDGGGIYNAYGAGVSRFATIGVGGGSGSMLAQDLRVDGNVSYQRGGGIYNEEVFIATNVLVSDNEGGDGGGIYNDYYGTFGLTELTVERNNARYDGKYGEGDGGGILSRGIIVIQRGLIGGVNAARGNTAERDGGGLFNEGDMTVVDVMFQFNDAGGHGGGVFNYGTIDAQGGGPIRYNSADGTAPNPSGRITIDCESSIGGAGGGIANLGTYSLAGGTPIIGNSATLAGGGIYNDGSLGILTGEIGENSSNGAGGGVYNDGDFLAVACGFGTCGTTVGNSAQSDGGALHNTGGYAAIYDSLILENTAGQAGGGISNIQGTVDLVRTTLLSNVASLRGGGISNCGGSLGGPSSYLNYAMENVTIVSNTAGAAGGGIHTQPGGWLPGVSDPSCSYRVCGNSSVTVNYVDPWWGDPISYSDCPTSAFTGMAYTTIADNEAPDGSGLYMDEQDTSGDVNCGYFGPSVAELRTTLIARNTGSPNCTGSDTTIQAVDYNNEDGNSCFMDGINDVTNTESGLGSLSGTGLAQPIPLLAGSAAIDRVPCTIGDPNGYGGYGGLLVRSQPGASRFGFTGGGDATIAPPTDERSILRPVPLGGYCDVGAYEINDGTTLLTLQVGPTTCGPAVGDYRQYYATAIYSDGSQIDVTDQVFWVGTQNVEFFSNPGEAYFDSPGGEYTVTANLGGLSASVDGYAWTSAAPGEPCEDVFNFGRFVNDWGDSRTQSMVTDLVLQDDGKLVAFVQFEREVTASTPSADDAGTCAAECATGTCTALWSCELGGPYVDFTDEASCLAQCKTPGDTCASHNWTCLTTVQSPGNAVVRVDTSGALDLSFNDSGIAHDPLGTFTPNPPTEATNLNVNPTVFGGVSLAPSGEIMASTPNLASVDGSSGALTRTASDLGGQLVAVYPASSANAGKVLAFGPTSITRYNADGTLDLLFGTAGVSDPAPANFMPPSAFADGVFQRTSGVILPNDKILLGGGLVPAIAEQGAGNPAKDSVQPGFVRYNADGTLDATYGSGGALSCAHQDGVRGFNLRLTYDDASGRVVAAGVGIVPEGFTGVEPAPEATCDPSTDPNTCVTQLCGSGTAPNSGACLDTYSFYALAGQEYTISTCGTAIGDTWLQLVSGPCTECNFSGENFNDDFCEGADGNGLASSCTCVAEYEGLVEFCASTCCGGTASWNYTVTSPACQVNNVVARDRPARFGVPGGYGGYGGDPGGADEGDFVAAVVVLGEDQQCDVSFNDTGTRAEPFVLDLPGGDDIANGVDTICDGRIVIGGWSKVEIDDFDNYWNCPECTFYKYFVMVFNSDGTMDDSFDPHGGMPGKVRFWLAEFEPSYRDLALSLAVDSYRGRIYVGGWVPDIATAYNDGAPATDPGAHSCWWDTDCPSPQTCDTKVGLCVGEATQAHRVSGIMCLGLGGNNLYE